MMGHTLWRSGSGNVNQYSNDRGQTWHLTATMARAFYACSSSGQIMYSSVPSSYLYQSVNYGVTWSPLISIRYDWRESC